MTTDKELIKTSCPRDCYDGCGILVIKRDGEITKVTGNPEHPSTRGALCGKCSIAYNGVWLDPKARLQTPLKRYGPKGSGSFVPVSWNEALGEIAERLNGIREGDGNGAEKIFHTHYTGTCSAIANSFPERFFEHIGATEVDPDTVCNNAGHAAWHYVFGDSVSGFDPRTAKDSNCIVVWGANPSHSAPHVHKHWLQAQDAKVIVIDPFRHETAAAADLYLQVRPGSDAALAFAMVHVMQREGLLDDAFIAAHVLGYEEVAPLIAGCTPEWGEAETGVPAALIEEAARLYGQGPSLLWLGQGLQRQPQGGNIFRACALLPALSGNVGKPGAGFYYLNATLSIGRRGLKGASYAPPGGDAGPPKVSQMDLPDLLQSPEAVQAYLVWNCNPAASNPNQAKMRTGLGREDLFTVVVDCFMTDTADYADIVLPAASFLEFDDLNASYFQLMLAPQVKCQEPLGESLPNQEIFRRLAKAMDLEDPTLHETDGDIIENILTESCPGLTWESLQDEGWAYLSDDPVILWEDGVFATSSGKIEIASAAAEADGHPRVPQPTSDAAPGEGLFRLLSPADKWLMNSSYGNDPKIVEMMGPAEVILHPEDAAALGVGEGEPVTLSNALGNLSFEARLSDAVPRRTLLALKSRWPKSEGAGANVNLLHQAQKTDMGESTSVHGTLVSVTRG